jgi:large subunit ribosomal protein L24
MSTRIKKNDTVYVRAGKDRGKHARVVRVLAKEGKALVEGVNMVHRHEKRRSQTSPGGIISKEAPIALCKLMVVDPKSGQPGRIRSVVKSDGKRVRVHVKTGNELD